MDRAEAKRIEQMFTAQGAGGQPGQPAPGARRPFNPPKERMW